MPENKTRPTGASVDDFLAGVGNPVRRADALALKEMMERVSGEPAVMWGPSMVGFGAYEYTYESGHSGTSFLTGFAPRKANLVVYILPGYGRFDDIMARLGRHRTGKACLYLGRLADIDMGVLEELVTASLAAMRARYPA